MGTSRVTVTGVLGDTRVTVPFWGTRGFLRDSPERWVCPVQHFLPLFQVFQDAKVCVRHLLFLQSVTNIILNTIT